MPFGRNISREVGGPSGNTMQLTLVEPSEFYREQFLRAVEDYRAGHDDQATRYARAESDFAGFIQTWHDRAAGRDLAPGYVPESMFWMIDERGEVLGVLRLRHRLTPIRSGHIGYDIRPSMRGQGLGTELLRLGLAEAALLGIKQALLVCDSDNHASRRVIEKNNGILQDEMLSEETGPMCCRYLIEIPS